MSAVLKQPSNLSHPPHTQPVVVVGTGPVGVRVVEELLRRDATIPITLYGNEPWEPYNRVRLSHLLTGETTFSAIQNPLKLPTAHRVVQHHNCEVVNIDPDHRRITDRLGNSQSYSKLVLATGSSPHIPHIEGIEKRGVFTFRNLDDAQNLIARRTRCRRAIVLGGGLLGLEAARGLQKHHTEVIVIEHATRLMAQQLDDDAAELLREKMLSLNVQVILGDSIKRVVGEECVSAVQLRSGRELTCDTIVVASGIRSNLSLARDAGLSVGRGIRVNDRMQTSDPDIYAIGECAEHREQVYGLVAPGLEQAAIAAHGICGGSSTYTGSQSATRLKVAGVSLFSMGRCGETGISAHLKRLSYRSYDNSRYRQLVLDRGRLVGAVAYGDWSEIRRVQETVQHQRYLWPWQRRRFLASGSLWPAAAAEVSRWPASAVVCQCSNVTRGTLSQAIQSGQTTVETLCAATGAGSVCGSCRPLLTDLVGGQALEPETGSRTLVWTALIGLLACLLILAAPAVPFPDSVQVSVRWDQLWRDGLIKQISGFALLGIALLVSVISLRKRVSRLSFGTFSGWRIVHVVAGALTAGLLIAHTGLRLGDNLNLLLILTFLALLAVGSVASGVIGLQHILPRTAAKRTREVSLWLHILLLWPLPALLGFHILKTYWF